MRRRPVLCLESEGSFRGKKKGAPERKEATTRPSDSFREQKYVLSFPLLFSLLLLPVPSPCPRELEGHVQTPRGPTAAGRACTTRAGEKERGSKRSSATHADAFFAGFAPARAASSSCDSPLAAENRSRLPCREKLSDQKRSESFPRKRSKCSQRRAVRSELFSSLSCSSLSFHFLLPSASFVVDPHRGARAQRAKKKPEPCSPKVTVAPLELP